MRRRAAWTLLLLAAALPLTACRSLGRLHAAPELRAFDAVDAPLVWRSGNTVYWRGGTDRVAVPRLRALLESGTVRTLDIESPGGSLAAGMDIGELVHAHQLDLVVSGIGCFSSCANAIFPAAVHKRIRAGAAVAWHGSALQRHWNLRTRLLRGFNTYLAQLRVRQAAYFQRIGVDARITVVGQDQNCRCVWMLSVVDMARYGIHQVDAPPDYPANVRTPGLQVLRLPPETPAE